MSQRGATNVPASVRARLLSESRVRGESFDQTLVYFAIERFLYRLSQTEMADRLVVKGATMLRAWGTPLGRPTRDIDFLGSIESSPAAVAKAVRECLAVAYPDDGIVFEDDVVTTEITVEDRYPGIRATVRGHLDRARFKLQLDIGIDDAVVPDPEWVDYPTLLELDAPRVLAYLPATAIAEKSEAMVTLGAANSRMKDFYDIWLLASTRDFAGAELARALRATFTHRGTALPSVRPLALTPAFYDDPATLARWRAFAAKVGTDAPPDFGALCEAIGEFIMAPTAAAAAAAADDGHDDDGGGADAAGPLAQNWTHGHGWSSRRA